MAHDDTTKQAFLDALAKSGIIADACREAKCTRTTVTNWRQDEQFDTAYREAIADSSDSLESEARRRAVDGVLRTRVIGSGENAQIIDEYVYSDALLQMLIKAKKPDEFAERTKSEITSPDGSLKPESSIESAARIAALLAEANRRRDADDPLFS